MTVLVTAASKHGSTFEIAEAIARELERRGVSSELLPIEDVTDLGRFDAVVLGSGVYMGHWLKPARTFVERYGDQLAERKTWLFSSGPVGKARRAPKEAVDVCDIDDMVAATRAAGHRLFAGKLDTSRLHFPERAVIRAVGAEDGDDRDWNEIESWAGEIAAQIGQPTPAPA